MDRFLGFIIVLSLAFACRGNIRSHPEEGEDLLCTHADREIVEHLLGHFSDRSKSETGELVRDIALFFLETPYVGQTLENGIDERMVVNLREMDCTTLAENCLALARTVKMKKTGFEGFVKELEKIRYRGGVRNGYLSRLHYFSDWIYDNDVSRKVKSMAKEISHLMVPNQVNFMSTHPDSYPVLKENPELIGDLAMMEKEISQRMTWFIPRKNLEEAESKIHDGDILAITTSIEGLDVTHVVIATKSEIGLSFIHASSKEMKVVVSDQTLAEYLDGSRMSTGIMVARPL